MARDERQTAQMKAFLDQGASFEGKLTFEGTVRIDGNFKGEIFSDDVLEIGENGVVEAEITVGTVVVNGQVKGNITASKAVELHAPAKVRGNIACPSLVIDRGVIFEGNSKMENLGGGGRPTAKPQLGQGQGQAQGEKEKK